MKLTYNVSDKPKFGQVVLFAIQQLLAIMAATIAVPAAVNQVTGSNLSSSAALFGAGVGTIVYLLFTKFRSPVFLGSSFSFIGSMFCAFAGGVSMSLGYLGLLIGAALAGLVYVIIAIVVKIAGTKWISKLMPPIIIGPTVAIIGLSLAGNAVGDIQKANAGGSVYIALICGFVTLAVTMVCSVYGKKLAKLVPFIIGILAGYAVATIFTLIGNATNNEALLVIDFQPFKDAFSTITLGSFIALPEFTFVKAIDGLSEFNASYFVSIVAAYVPVAFVVFAEHLADHKNLSSIIEKDLLEDPGLPRTLLGDGIGSIAGTIFGGCPNTTYGESIACVAITKNASVVSILGAAFASIIISFFTPFVCFLQTIPACVMGGVCVALYGFIAVSGLKMIQNVDLNDNKNLFVVSVVLVSGVGGFAISFGNVTITTVACSIILGILANLLLSHKKSDD